ncbi:MAG: DUF4333 domain-containing protein [Coleofasciculaceae cyanobacterium]
MKQYQNTANCLHRLINPLPKKISFILLIALGSTTIISGCQSNQSASNTPGTSSTPGVFITPAVSSTQSTSNTPGFLITPTPPASSANKPNKRLNDIKQVETGLQRLYSQQTGVSIESIKCPENAQLTTGSTFECQAKAQGVNFGIQVKMENDQGKLDSMTNGLLILTKIEQLLQQSIKERANIEVTADCGSPKIRPLKAGDVFTCEVKDPKGQARKATVTVKDEQGNVSVKI